LNQSIDWKLWHNHCERLLKIFFFGFIFFNASPLYFISFACHAFITWAIWRGCMFQCQVKMHLCLNDLRRIVACWLEIILPSVLDFVHILHEIMLRYQTVDNFCKAYIPMKQVASISSIQYKLRFQILKNFVELSREDKGIKSF